MSSLPIGSNQHVHMLTKFSPSNAIDADKAGGFAKSSSSASRDNVDTSSPEKIGMYLFEKLLGMKPGADETFNVQDIQDAYQQRFAQQSGQLLRLMKSSDVDTSQQEAVLQTDTMGKISETNFHPQQQAIEQLFRDNPQLVNEFQKLSGMATVLRAVENSEEFGETFKENPYAAIANFSEMFEGLGNQKYQVTVADSAVTDNMASAARATQRHGRPNGITPGITG